MNTKKKDADLERFLNGFEDRPMFISGMKNYRHDVFHVKSQRTWRNRDLGFFTRVCRQQGTLAVMTELQKIIP